MAPSCDAPGPARKHVVHPGGAPPSQPEVSSPVAGSAGSRTHNGVKRVREESSISKPVRIHQSDLQPCSSSSSSSPPVRPVTPTIRPEPTSSVSSGSPVGKNIAGLSPRKPLFKSVPQQPAAQHGSPYAVSYPDHGKVISVALDEKYPTTKVPVKDPDHSCSEICKFAESSEAGLHCYIRAGLHTPFALPMLCGWIRVLVDQAAKIRYITPCGIECDSEAKIDMYLKKVKSVLPISLFTFDPDMDISKKLLILQSKVKHFKTDITNKMMLPYQIPVVNCFTADIPSQFSYVRKTTKSEGTMAYLASKNISERTEGCGCKDRCKSGQCLCIAAHNGGPEAVRYKHGRLAEKFSVVMECNDHCKCGPQCGNRVSTSTIQPNMLIYFYPDKGWGVRAVCDIPQGIFMGYYHGQIIHDNEVSEKNDKFLVALDISSRGEDNSNGDEELLNIDGRRFGNVSRFFNHSCDPNLFPQVMYREYDSPFIYNIGFFTKRRIKAGEELCWDYGYIKGSVNDRQIKCCCGSSKCKIFML